MAHVDFSAIINDFLTAELGEDVRDSLVAIAEALQESINTQIATVSADLTDTDPNTAPRTSAVAEQLSKTLRAADVLPSGNLNEITTNSFYALSPDSDHTYENLPDGASGVMYLITLVARSPASSRWQILYGSSGRMWTRRYVTRTAGSPWDAWTSDDAKMDAKVGALQQIAVTMNGVLQPTATTPVRLDDIMENGVYVFSVVDPDDPDDAGDDGTAKFFNLPDGASGIMCLVSYNSKRDASGTGWQILYGSSGRVWTRRFSQHSSGGSWDPWYSLDENYRKQIIISGAYVQASNKEEYFSDFNDAPVNSVYRIDRHAELLNAPYGDGMSTGTGEYDGTYRDVAGWEDGTLITLGAVVPAEKDNPTVYKHQIFISGHASGSSTGRVPPDNATIFFRTYYQPASRWGEWRCASDRRSLTATNIAIRRKFLGRWLDRDPETAPEDNPPKAVNTKTQWLNPQYMSDYLAPYIAYVEGEPTPMPYDEGGFEPNPNYIDSHKFFTDFNDAPFNSIYQIDLDCVAEIMANNPRPGKSSVLITTGFSWAGMQHGKIQLCVGVDAGMTFCCVRYGFIEDASKGEYDWTEWLNVADAGEVDALKPRVAELEDVIYAGRDAATNTPRVLTWFSGLDPASTTQRFADIPAWSVCAAPGTKIKSMIEIDPEVVFADTAVLRDDQTYWVSKIDLGTADPATAFYAMQSVDGEQKWTAYAAGATPRAVVWHGDAGLQLYTPTDVPNKQTQPEAYAEYCAGFLHKLPLWSRTSVIGSVLKDCVGDRFPDPENIVETRTYMIDKTAAGSFNPAEIFHVFTYSTGRSWYGYRFAEGDAYWFRFTTPTDTTMTVEGAPADAAGVGALIWRGRDTEDNTPRTLTWFSGLDQSSTTQRFEDIPRWSFCSASGAKIRSMIEIDSTVSFPDLAGLRDGLSYWIAKISLGTADTDPAAMVYLMRSINGTQKWIGYSLAASPRTVIWRGDNGLFLFVPDDIPDKETAPEAYAEYCNGFFHRLPLWSRTSVNGGFLKDCLGSSFPDPENIVTTRTYMIDKTFAGTSRTTEVFHLFTYSTGRSWYGYRLSSWESMSPVWYRFTTPTDTSLTVEGAPADAKAVGDALGSARPARVLVFGNSFAYDDLGLLPEIMRQLGSPIIMGLLYISGGEIADHIYRFDNEIPYDSVARPQQDGKERAACYSFYDGTKWTNHNEEGAYTAKGVMRDGAWDYVVMHIGTGAGTFDADAFADKIAAFVNYPVEFLANLSHGASATTQEGATWAAREAAAEVKFTRRVNACRALVEGGEVVDYISGAVLGSFQPHHFMAVLPSATALQNLRQLADFKTLGDYSVTVDGEPRAYLGYDATQHTQNGIGTMVTAYAAALKLLEILSGRQRLFGLDFLPTTAWIKSPYNLYTAYTSATADGHGQCVGVTEENALTAMKCAYLAYRHPYETTVLQPNAIPAEED